MKSLHQPSIYEDMLPKVRINCQECSGLCCVALYFSKIDGFPQHKEAGVPCLHLEEHFTCDIHACLKDKKLSGCLGYDCFGAGQHVTSTLCSTTWRETDHKQQIFDGFQKVYQMQEILWYLIIASMLSKDKRIDEYIPMNVQVTSTLETIISFDIEGYRQDVNDLLKSICRTLGCYHEKKTTMYLGMDLRTTNLNFQDFSMSLLIGANAKGCTFYGSNFLGADVRDMNIMDANLRESLFLTQRQVNQMVGNQHTILPSYIQRPNHWAK